MFGNRQMHIAQIRDKIIVAIVVFLCNPDFCCRSVCNVCYIGAKEDFIADKGFGYCPAAYIFPARVYD